VTVCKLNIPPAPFKGGDVTVSRMGKGDGQQDGEMGWSVGRGEVAVSRTGRCDGQQDGEMGWFVNLTSPQPPSKGEM